VGLFKLGSNFDEQFDKIRVGTGATGDALLGLQGSFNNVLKSVPTSFEDAGSAIADLNTRLGLTGKPLEDLAGQFINLSRITKTDVAANVDNLTRTFGDWGVSTEDQADTLDKLYRASQSSGIGIDELSQSLVTAGAPLRNLGFNIDESAALLAVFNKTGVNTDTVMAGLKAGVGKLAKAGEDVPATFSRIVDEITAMGPGTEATGLAIELFGQRAGPDMADAIAGGKFAIDDMLDAIQNGEDTINGAAADTASFSEKWLLFKNKVLVGLQPLAMKVFDGVGKAMDRLGPVVERVIGWFSDKLPPVVARVRELFEKNWPKIRKAIGDVFDWLVRNVVPKVTAAFDRIVDGAKGIYNFFNDNRNALVGVLVAITAGFVAWAVSAAAAAVATLAAAAPFIAVGVAVAAAAGAIGWAYQNVEWFRDAVDAVGRFLTDTLWPILQDVFGWMQDNVPPILSAIVDAFTVVWKFIQDKVLPILKVLV
jgi:phage-related minor tail protein